VLDREPPDQDNPLRELGNVIITPHQAGLSPDAWPRIVQLCWENVVRAARGQEPHYRVSP
jgi:phosphoglycerate dehydrogenase-like enzyme